MSRSTHTPPFSRRKLQNYFDQWGECGRKLRIATVSKSGVGRSTAINNVLELEGAKAERCATNDEAYATTSEVKIYSKTKNGVKLEMVDTPAIGGLNKSDAWNVLKDLSKETEEKADTLLYFVSLHPSAKIDTGDVENIKLITSAYGRDIWSHTILVLTYANQRRNAEKYRGLIDRYACKFQQALIQGKVFEFEVKSILSENVEKGTIPAVPIGLDPKDPLLFCRNWSAALLLEVFKRARPENMTNLLKMDGHIQPATEIAGCVVAGVAAGTAVGTAAGAPIGVIPALAITIPAGAATGGVIGLTLRGLFQFLRNKYLMRKAERKMMQQTQNSV